MDAWRLVKKRYASAPLDPVGARRYGGRWNSKGTDALYAADSISLAALEILVHLHNNDILTHFLLCKLALPDSSIMTLAQEDLPHNWRGDPPPASTQAIGDQWLRANLALALRVPSTVIPQQYNLLINPRHSDFPALLGNLDCEGFHFDPRLAGQ
ncbi:MAG TPA: RES domain-containing protein [Planctomycetaceae bacterium]|nr:RES domain-containing protein [Planctomycetaceae bacterium]